MPQLPPPVAAVIDRSLAFQKNDRYPDAGSMQVELRAVFERHQGVPLPPVGRSPKWVAEWTPRSPQHPPHASPEVHVSVELKPSGSDSIMVDVSEIDGSGDAQRFELRRYGKPDKSTFDDEPLSELSLEPVVDEEKE